MIADSISMRLSGGEGVHQCEYKTLVFKVKNVLRSCEKIGSRKWRRTRLKRTIPGKSRQGHRPSITNLFFFLFLFSIVAVADGQRMFTAGDSEFSLWQCEMFQHIFLSISSATVQPLYLYQFEIFEHISSNTGGAAILWFKGSYKHSFTEANGEIFQIFLKISFEIKANAEDP